VPVVCWESVRFTEDREEQSVTSGCSFCNGAQGKALIGQITTENEKLLQERRRLLQRITDQEETPWSNRSTVAALQSR